MLCISQGGGGGGRRGYFWSPVLMQTLLVSCVLMLHSSLAHREHFLHYRSQPMTIISADGRKEELPREHFLSCNSLQLVQMHGMLWRRRTPAARAQGPLENTVQLKQAPLFPAYCSVRMGTFLVSLHQFSSKRAVLPNVPSSGMTSGDIQQTGKWETTPRNKTNAKRWQNLCWLRAIFS